MSIKDIIRLPPQKLVIYLLYAGIGSLTTVIGVLWWKLDSVQDRSNQQTDISAVYYKLQLKVRDSTHAAEKKEWSSEKKDLNSENKLLKAQNDSITREWNEFLKQRLAIQEKVNRKAEIAERKVDALEKQATNLSTITKEMKLNKKM